MKKKQDEKDPGKSYTTMVMESLRDQTGPPEGSSAGSWEERKKAQQGEECERHLHGDQQDRGGYCAVTTSTHGNPA